MTEAARAARMTRGTLLYVALNGAGMPFQKYTTRVVDTTMNTYPTSIKMVITGGTVEITTIFEIIVPTSWKKRDQNLACLELLRRADRHS